MFENIRLSFQGIFSHKMRSFLTMLGIIIGIAAIIAIVSTIRGTNEQIKDNLVGNGDNLVDVTMSQGGIQVLPSDGADVSSLPVVDADMLNDIRKLKGVKNAAVYHKANAYGGIGYNDVQLNSANVLGARNDYISLDGYILEKGRLFADRDFTDYRNVCLVDDDTEQSLFSGESGLDKTIEINGIPFTVVGIIKKEDAYEPVLSSPEEWYNYYGDRSAAQVIVADTSWPVIYGYDEPYQVLVQADSTEDMTAAGKNTQDYLNGKIQGGASADQGSDSENAIQYQSEDTLEKAKELQKLSNATNQQLIWIASISLLVGGIGVMNIMLVSVTERTREIGLKKALGARRGVILGQFLTEAAVLTSMGGIIGVGAGIGLSYLISRVAEVPVAISVPAILVAVVFSMAIGIIFGLIPSVKAAKLNPIDALRYE